jgi:hypothetical protein
MPQAIVKQQPIKDRFVEELRTGMSPGKAARTAGISRAEAYRWRNEDPAFDRAWVEAVAEGIDKLEDEAFRRAVDGYNARTVRDKYGNIISEMREYSDSLLALLLKVRRPETFNRPVEAVSSRVDVRVSLSEARERLERLGLPIRRSRETTSVLKTAPRKIRRRRPSSLLHETSAVQRID